MTLSLWSVLVFQKKEEKKIEIKIRRKKKENKKKLINYFYILSYLLDINFLIILIIFNFLLYFSR